jgi:hypothetical protein
MISALACGIIYSLMTALLWALDMGLVTDGAVPFLLFVSSLHTLRP